MKDVGSRGSSEERLAVTVPMTMLTPTAPSGSTAAGRTVPKACTMIGGHGSGKGRTHRVAKGGNKEEESRDDTSSGVERKGSPPEQLLCCSGSDSDTDDSAIMYYQPFRKRRIATNPSPCNQQLVIDILVAKASTVPIRPPGWPFQLRWDRYYTNSIQPWVVRGTFTVGPSFQQGRWMRQQKDWYFDKFLDNVFYYSMEPDADGEPESPTGVRQEEHGGSQLSSLLRHSVDRALNTWDDQDTWEPMDALDYSLFEVDRTRIVLLAPAMDLYNKQSRYLNTYGRLRRGGEGSQVAAAAAAAVARLP